jgi:hypothetical protein
MDKVEKPSEGNIYTKESLGRMNTDIKGVLMERQVNGEGFVTG